LIGFQLTDGNIASVCPISNTEFRCDFCARRHTLFLSEDEMAPGEVNLLLKYRLRGESDLRVKGAARISVDRTGALTLTDPRTGFLETFPLTAIEVLSIQFAKSSAATASTIRRLPAPEPSVQHVQNSALSVN
jgi:hypothetical protein